MKSNIEELEKIIDSSIIEVQQKDLETKEHFKEFKKMTNHNISNEQLLEAIQRLEKDTHQNNRDILSNKREIIKASKEDYDLSIHAITELHYLKKHFGKITILIVLLVFVCGTGFGTLYESWLPYVDTLVDFFKITNQVSKGV